MATQQISEKLKRFIREHLHSVYTLETLLLFHRNQEQGFRAGDIALELGFEEDVAQDQISRLVSIRVIKQSEDDHLVYIYGPSDDYDRTPVDSLSTAYSKHRVPILSLILADRSDRIRLFAEAFRLIRGSD